MMDQQELVYDTLLFEIFQHEYLGYLLQGYAAVRDENSVFIEEKRINSENAKDYLREFLPEKGLSILSLVDKTDIYAIVKKYNKSKKPIKPEDFFKTQFINDDFKKMIKKYVENNIYEALRKIRFDSGKVYINTIGGFAEENTLIVEKESAKARFKFEKNEEGIFYSIEISHKGKILKIANNNSELITTEKPILKHGNKLYFFENDELSLETNSIVIPLDGRKFVPFLKNEQMNISPSTEKTYLEKIILPHLSDGVIEVKGYELNVTGNEVRPKLTISDTLDGEKHLLLSFMYDDKEIRYNEPNDTTVKLEEKNGQFILHSFQRNKAFEKAIVNQLKELGLFNSSGCLFGFKENHSSWKLLEWMGNYNQKLEESGFEISQEGTEIDYYFMPSQLEMQILYSDDWFDIKARVQIGEFLIPFTSLRQHILKGIREYILPNGKKAVLPELWFSQLRSVATFSEQDGEDENVLRLNKIFFPIIRELNSEEEEADTLSPLSVRLKEMEDFSGIEKVEPSPKFKAELREYQQSGLEWLWAIRRFNFGGILADDMGLGKTVQTIALLQKDRDESEDKMPSLLVVPSSLIFNWFNELRKFAPDLRIYLYSGQQRAKSAMLFRMHDLVITTYGTVRVDIEMLRKIAFNYVILDEGQSIKNPEASVTKAIKQLEPKRRLVLSGTPIENSLTDLWSIFQFAVPGLLGTEKHFREHFQNPIERQSDKEASERLQRIIQPFLLRRTKEQVAKDLPPKIEQVIYTSMTDEQEEEYERVKSSFRNEMMKSIESIGLGKSQFLLLRGLTQLRQLANHPAMVNPEYKGSAGKFDQVMDMIGHSIQEGHKMLVFSQFVRHLNLVKAHLKQKGIAFEYLDGATPSKERKAIVERFEANNDTKVFLLSLKAGGLGLNLTSADYVVLLDPWWNPAVEAQAIDRSHRIGQQKTVFSYKFITQNSVEEKILKLQEKKKRLSSELIRVEESLVKTLDVSDVLELLS